MPRKRPGRDVTVPLKCGRGVRGGQRARDSSDGSDAWRVSRRVARPRRVRDGASRGGNGQRHKVKTRFKGDCGWEKAGGGLVPQGNVPAGVKDVDFVP